MYFASLMTLHSHKLIPFGFGSSYQYMTHYNYQIHDTCNTLLVSSAFGDIRGGQQQNPGTDMYWCKKNKPMIKSWGMYPDTCTWTSSFRGLVIHVRGWRVLDVEVFVVELSFPPSVQSSFLLSWYHGFLLCIKDVTSNCVGGVSLSRCQYVYKIFTGFLLWKYIKLHFPGECTMEMLQSVWSSLGNLLCMCTLICLTIGVEEVIIIQTHQVVSGGKGSGYSMLAAVQSWQGVLCSPWSLLVWSICPVLCYSWA